MASKQRLFLAYISEAKTNQNAFLSDRMFRDWNTMLILKTIRIILPSTN